MSRPPAAIAITLLLLPIVVACRARSAGPAERPALLTPPRAPVALADALVLQSGGPPPGDTVLRLAPGEGRTVVLRHPIPAGETFAMVTVPAAAIPAGAELRLAAVPGAYGLDVAFEPAPAAAVELRFSWARWFAAPPEARRWGGTAAYERALAIGRLDEAGQLLGLLPTRRPAPDVAAAEIVRNGRYLVAAAP